MPQMCACTLVGNLLRPHHASAVLFECTQVWVSAMGAAVAAAVCGPLLAGCVDGTLLAALAAQEVGVRLCLAAHVAAAPIIRRRENGTA